MTTRLFDRIAHFSTVLAQVATVLGLTTLMACGGAAKQLDTDTTKPGAESQPSGGAESQPSSGSPTPSPNGNAEPTQEDSGGARPPGR